MNNGHAFPNGKGRLLGWLTALTLPTLLGVAAGWVTSTNQRLARHAEHLAALQAQLADVREELRHLNHKLDERTERDRN